MASSERAVPTCPSFVNVTTMATSDAKSTNEQSHLGAPVASFNNFYAT